MKSFFLLCAGFNFVVVVVFVLGQNVLFPLFGLQVTPSATTFLYFLMALVAIFGVAYYKIAFDPIRYSELILFGAQAKLILVVMGVLNVALGLVLWPILIPLFADLVFAAIFFKLYRQITH